MTLYRFTQQPPITSHKKIGTGTWNVRGMIQMGKAESAKAEIKQCRVDILDLSEVHQRGGRHLITDCGKRVFFPRTEYSFQEHSPLCVIILQCLKKTVKGYTSPCEINLVQVYTPTSCSTKEPFMIFITDWRRSSS